MKPHDINLAIAEFGGWSFIEFGDEFGADGVWTGGVWTGKCPRIKRRLPLPNFYGDLNALRDTLIGLTKEQQFDFVYELNDVLNLVPLDSPASFREAVLWLFVTATPPQIAEALLRAIGKWKEN